MFYAYNFVEFNNHEALAIIKSKVNIVKQDLDRIPFPLGTSNPMNSAVVSATHTQMRCSFDDEMTFSFIVPPCWDTGVSDASNSQYGGMV